MANLSQDDVRHIASLARLTLSDEEVAKYAKEMTSIIGFIEQLSEVDTSSVIPTAQVTGTQNVLRKDDLRDSPIADEDELLATSPLPIVDHQIETPTAHG